MPLTFQQLSDTVNKEYEAFVASQKASGNNQSFVNRSGFIFGSPLAGPYGQYQKRKADNSVSLPADWSTIETGILSQYGQGQEAQALDALDRGIQEAQMSSTFGQNWRDQAKAQTAGTAPVAPLTTAGVPTNTLASQGASGATTTPPASNYAGVSIVDYLKSVGQASDYATRANLAQKYGITNYQGTAEQNTQLLNKLRGGATTPPILNTGNSAIQTSDQSINAENTAKADQQKAIQDQIVEVQKQIALKTAQLQVQQYNEALGISAPITPKAPDVPVAKTTREALLSEKGVAVLEAQQNKLKADQRALDDSFLLGTQKVGNKLEPMELISAENQELQRQYNEKKFAIDRDLATIQDELQTKYNIIDSIMKDTQQDYENSVKKYELEFNSVVKLQELLGKKDTSNSTISNVVEDNARANLTLILNTAKSTGKSFEDLDPSLQLSIKKLEMQISNYPQGMTEFLLKNLSKADKVIYKSPLMTDTDGKQFTQVITQDADGNLSTQNVYSGGEKVVPANAKETEIDRVSNQLTNFGQRDYVSLGYYNEMKAGTTLTPDEFDKKFMYLLSADDQTKLKAQKSTVAPKAPIF